MQAWGRAMSEQWCLGWGVKERSSWCWLTQGRVKAYVAGANWASGVDLGAQVMRTSIL
jgi:hypothetical protein